MAPQTPPKGGHSRAAAAGLLIVRIALGAYFVALGLEKIGWLADSAPLAARYAEWVGHATPASRWYLDRVMPGTPVFARLVPLGEVLGGLALAAGFWTRLASAMLVVLSVHWHVASAAIFGLGYVSDPGGLPLLAALLALAIGGGALPWSARR